MASSSDNILKMMAGVRGIKPTQRENNEERQ